jgi:long-chain acyl-CoA synthetase
VLRLTTRQAAELTFPQLLELRARETPEALAIRVEEDGAWRDWSFRRLWEEASRFGAALLELGVERGDRVGMICRPRVEVLAAYLGAQGAGCVPFGIYPPTAPDVVAGILDEASPRVVLTDTDAEAAPAVVVSLERGDWARLLESGTARRDEWRAAVDAGDSDAPSSLFFTSGTTGRPKGALLSSRNLVVAYMGVYGEEDGLLPPPDEADRTLHEIPFASAAGPWFALIHTLVFGTVAHIARPGADPDEARRAVQPTIYLGAPRIWEVCAGAMTAEIDRGSPLRRAGYRAAMAIRARAVATPRPRAVLRLADLAARRLVLVPTLRRWGLGDCRYAICGGAAMPPELVRSWHLWGVTIREMYGSTECGGLATLVRGPVPRPGTAGHPTPFFELRIGRGGEILLKGPGLFAGYLGKPDATARAIDGDGWLHTGDLGELLEDGSLRMLDRMSDVVVTPTGDTVIVSQIESALASSPYIRHALVVGNGRPDLAALIELDPEHVATWARRRGMPPGEYAELASDTEVQRMIGAEIATANAALARAGKAAVARFGLLPEPLDFRDPEIATVTRKLRRRNVAERYAGLIDSIYAGVSAAAGGRSSSA